MFFFSVVAAPKEAKEPKEKAKPEPEKKGTVLPSQY